MSATPSGGHYGSVRTDEPRRSLRRLSGANAQECSGQQASVARTQRQSVTPRADYLLSVLSRQALLADPQAVDRATVISLRAVMVYVLPPLNDTAGLVSAFVAVSA